MFSMSPVDQKPPVNHDAEAAQQKLIADDVEAVTSKVPQETSAANAPIVKLRSKNVDQYPVTVAVVGSDNLVFESATSTVEVPATVAEQIAYSPVVEVVE